MEHLPTPPRNSRYGFHYYPDTLHYRESDLRTWLPELRDLGAAWLNLIAPPDRAIPEFFLRSLLSAGVEPVLHFPLDLSTPPRAESLQLLLDTYSRWGAHYICLFNRPNRRQAWATRDWAQSELVERFLDVYLPLSEAILAADLIPVFPPLEPGGDYWDTAFLRSALQSIQRRGHHDLLRRLVLGAYARADNRSLDWGAGGPERWPGARPYFTPPGEQDQRGFRIFDWYVTLAQAVLGTAPPILLMGMGSQIGDSSDLERPTVDASTHALRNLTIARLLGGDPDLQADPSVEEAAPIPTEVIGGMFWLLAAPADSQHSRYAWYKPAGDTLPIVGALRQWAAQREPGRGSPPPLQANAPSGDESHPIANYLLLPTYEWGIADWHLEVIRPYIKRYRPTVGFSLDEAAYARRVTVVGGSQAFPEEALEALRTAGCLVERIQGDGTSIASQLANV